MIKTNSKFLGSFHFYKKAITIAVPIMIQLFIQALISLIDNFMVADLGDLKMSGVNVANQIIFVFITGLNILCSAGGIFMSQYNGIKDSRGMRQAYRFKQILCFVFASVLLLICILIPDLILGLLVEKNSSKIEIVGEAKIYTGIIIFTFIPMAFSTSISSSFREIGNVKVPMYIASISTLINTIANYVLIYGHFGVPRLEVAGAAYATVIARCAELIMFLIYIKKTGPMFYVKLKNILKVNLKIFKDIFKKSVLIFVADMSWVISEIVATAVYNSRGGAEVVSGMSAGWTIANLFFLAFPAINTSIGVIVGGTLGKNELKEARLQAKWLLHGAVIAGTVTGVLEAASILLIPIFFGRLSAESQYTAKMLLIFIAVYMPIWCYQNAQYAVARSGGDAIMGAWVDTTVNIFLFMPAMFLLFGFTTWSSPVMYGVSKLTSVLKAFLAYRQLKKERWVKNLTV